MPRFWVETDFGRISEERMREMAARGRRIEAEHFPDIKWERSHVCTGPDGSITSFCIYEAPGEERLHEHTRRMGEDLVSRVYEVIDDIEPADVRV